MTVAAGTDYAELAWTGVENAFAPGITAQSKSHVTVTYLKDGVVTTLTDGVHLALAKAGAEGVNGAITATPLAMPAASGIVRFERTTPATQPTDFENLAAYAPAVHTNLHDAAALRSQEHAGRIARISGTIGGEVLDKFAAASSTAITIGTGNKVFSIDAGKVFRPGDVVMVSSAANAANYMTGPVVSYVGTTLTVNVVKTGGSGSHADWVIRVAGVPGADGAQGPPGPGSGDMLRANNLSDVADPVAAFNNIKQQATATSIGAAEIATQAEVDAGVDDARIVTPAKLKVFVEAAVAALRAGVDTSLDTLAEIAAALDGKLAKAQNLSDLASAAAARSSAGLNIDQATSKSFNTDFSIAATDRTIISSSTAMTANHTATLPAANAVNAGQELDVLDLSGVTGAQTLTIQRAGSDTVNGTTSVALAEAYAGWRFKSDGSSKWTAQYLPPAKPSASVTAGDGITVSGTTVSINTNNANGVGAYNLCVPQSGTIASGSTGAVNACKIDFDGAGGALLFITAAPGTWRNVSGQTIQRSLDQLGLCIRVS